ncbi:MAG: trigger factor [Chloroflexi bacterium]|nr:trigger factor [Chloroflexota bacterium]
MKIETHPRDDHQVTMIVELEAEKLEGARRRAARRIAEKVKISGFRPGKAPFDVVRRLYGDAAINEEAVEILVDEVYPEALKEAKIDPAAAGQLENIESLEPPKFIFTVPLKPSVELGDYQAVRLAYEFSAPSDEKLEEEITNLRRMYAKTESVDRTVQDGDYVLLDVVGRKAKAADDEVALIERNGFALVARTEEKETEWPFVGFASKLIGINPGESKEFSHKYPKDFSEESLAGQNVKFKITIKTVRSVTMPELNDDFAKMVGIGQTVDELHQRMRENIETEARNTYEDEYFEKVFDLIKAGATIKYPPQVLDHEIEHVLEDVERRLKSQGVENMEAYFKMIDSNREKFIEEQARPTSVKRLERGLVMDELARAEKIEIDNESLEAEFNNAWATLATSDEDFAKRTKNGTKASREIVDAVAMDSANRLLTRRVLDRVKEIAASTGEPEPVAKPAPKKSKKAAAPAPEAAPEASSDTPVEVEPAQIAADVTPKKRTTKKKTE